MIYDIIGDIHGCADTLTAHLQSLGYELAGSHYRHPKHQALFLGDFVDRGPKQREVLSIVRGMIDNEAAQAVMGNHEFNAIGWAVPRADGNGFCRAHSPANSYQHSAFLEAFKDDPAAYQDTLDWFRSLPMWLDLGELRLVHATWCEQSIATLAEAYDHPVFVSDALLQEAKNNHSPIGIAVETLLKGFEVELPDGYAFTDKEGTRRTAMRTRWWKTELTSYRQAYMGPPEFLSSIPDLPMTDVSLPGYPSDAPPLFTGHYWLSGTPAPLATNHACVDYSVARPGGHLVSYRWQGESVLTKDHFYATSRVEP